MNRATILTECKVPVLRRTSLMLLAGVLMGSLARAQTAAPAAPVVPATPTAPAASTARPAVAGTPTHSQPAMMPRRAAMYYESLWGVDLLSVKAMESGELIRFTYRVLDPTKSEMLNDKKFEPSLIFPGGHVKLVVPSLENVGALRQSSTPVAGKSYWMAFSNPGRMVKRGDRVDIEIGQFRAEGLIVE
jgi:hypothetical protein